MRALQDVVCRNRFTGCGVAPDPPLAENALAVCGASGHCEVMRFYDLGSTDAGAGTTDASASTDDAGSSTDAGPTDGGPDGI